MSGSGIVAFDGWLHRTVKCSEGHSLFLLRTACAKQVCFRLVHKIQNFRKYLVHILFGNLGLFLYCSEKNEL